MRLFSTGLAAVLALLAAQQAASAATITTTLIFSADNLWVVAGASPAPTSPVIGSFTLTFDPDQDYFGSSDVVKDSLNIASSSGTIFNYNAAIDSLYIGGSNTGAQGMTDGDNDFILHAFFDATNGWKFQSIWSLNYNVASPFGSYRSDHLTQLTALPATTPIPASLSLFLTALLGVGGLAFHRSRLASGMTTAEA